MRPEFDPNFKMPEIPQTASASDLSAAPCSEFKHLLVEEIGKGCEQWEPLSETQKASIAGTVTGMFSLVEILGVEETVEKFSQNSN